jgi:IMP dehydrogenase/GMP reductase
MELFDFDDILINPATISDIRSRSEINARLGNGLLPLFTAPMDTVVCGDNKGIFKSNGIMPVLPRIKQPNPDYTSTSEFLSYSLEDFERIFLQSTPTVHDELPMLALIDVANGHMLDLIKLSKSAKNKYGDGLTLMVGNIANPDTFIEYCNAGVDYVRIGIGNGNGCLTTVQTGVGYPMASLIEGCVKFRKTNSWARNTKIVADGGFKKYSDIIKALAIGADYVMLGSILNKCLESCGETTKEDGTVINQYTENSLEMFNVDIPLYKVFRGMSTKEVQKEWGKTNLTTSEGVVRRNQVEYTVSGWVHNFESYLKSAMSYTAKKELHHFIGGVQYNKITINSFRRFDK